MIRTSVDLTEVFCLQENSMAAFDEIIIKRTLSSIRRRKMPKTHFLKYKEKQIFP
jgi:hypothetical protein